MAALQGRMRLAVGLLFFISFYGMMGLGGGTALSWAGGLPEAGRKTAQNGGFLLLLSPFGLPAGIGTGRCLSFSNPHNTTHRK